MSKPATMSIDCYECHTPQKFVMWQTLNSTLDPELKQDLLNRSLTRFTCSKCGLELELIYPLLYHDMERELMIWLRPDGVDEEDTKLKEELSLAERECGHHSLRIVQTVIQLIEKILIWDCGLDDRAVEMMKPMLPSNSPQLTGQLGSDFSFYFSGVKETCDAKALVFDVASESTSVELTVPYNLYLESTGMLVSRLAEFGDGRGSWLRVDLKHVAKA